MTTLDLGRYELGWSDVTAQVREPQAPGTPRRAPSDRCGPLAPDRTGRTVRCMYPPVSARNLVHHPDPRLSTPPRPVSDFDSGLRSLASAMTLAMVELNGVGLAANQLGVDARLFVSVVDELLVCVNPTVVDVGGHVRLDEGCLSVPGQWYRPHRPARLVLGFFDLAGHYHQREVSGFAAQVAAHEVDHLDGKLLFERERP
jgi:peptide deformylase